MPTPGSAIRGRFRRARSQGLRHRQGEGRLLICYDIEFPLLSRALAEAGADVILAPPHRNRMGLLACAHGCRGKGTGEPGLYGAFARRRPAPFCAACPTNTGAAGIFAPSDKGFPPGGVIALGEMNKAQWVHATVDLDLMAQVRESGGVQTFRHWPNSPAPVHSPPRR